MALSFLQLKSRHRLCWVFYTSQSHLMETTTWFSPACRTSDQWWVCLWKNCSGTHWKDNSRWPSIMYVMLMCTCALACVCYRQKGKLEAVESQLLNRRGSLVVHCIVNIVSKKTTDVYICLHVYNVCPLFVPFLLLCSEMLKLNSHSEWSHTVKVNQRKNSDYRHEQRGGWWRVRDTPNWLNTFQTTHVCWLLSWCCGKYHTD